MRKEYFKPVTEIIEAELTQQITGTSDDWADGKENTPDGNGGGNNNDENGDQDIWNSHFNIWD